MSSKEVTDTEAFFENAEQIFLQSLLDGSQGDFIGQFRRAFSHIKGMQLSSTQLPRDKAAKILNASNKIRHITEYLLQLSRESKVVLEEAVQDVTSLFNNRTKPMSKNTDKQDSLNSQVLRCWFLEHIGHPFPSPEVKEELAELTNAKLKELEIRDELPKYGPQAANKPITKSQCQLWFINTRRRSTWTKFYREYAYSDNTKMTKLVSILKGENENAKDTVKLLSRLLTYGEDGRTKEWYGEALKKRVAYCQKHWFEIIEWLEQRPHEQHSDWLSQAIEEAKTEYNQSRRMKRNERREARELKLQRARADMSDDEDDNADQQPRKRAKNSKASNSNAKHLQENRQIRAVARKSARRPSTMTHSLKQDRNVSSSSTSTLDTTCSTISTSSTGSYVTASSPLANYGEQDPSKQKNVNVLESLYHQPDVLTNDLASRPTTMQASPVTYEDDELCDDDGEFELEDEEEAKQDCSQ